jgi:uncharacterized protein YjdB
LEGFPNPITIGRNTTTPPHKPQSKIMKKTIPLLITALFSIFSFLSCSGGDKNVPVSGIALNKTTLTLNVNAQETLTATIQPDNASNKSVSWSSSNTGIASVNSNGLVTGVSGGTANITATTVDGGRTATCAVTVTVPLTGVTLDKTSIALTVGGTEQLTATLHPENVTNRYVTWSSSNSAVASVRSGLVTANSTGTATITITTVDGNKTASCVVTVSPAAVRVTGVSLN